MVLDGYYSTFCFSSAYDLDSARYLSDLEALSSASCSLFSCKEESRRNSSSGLLWDNSLLYFLVSWSFLPIYLNAYMSASDGRPCDRCVGDESTSIDPSATEEGDSSHHNDGFQRRKAVLCQVKFMAWVPDGFLCKTLQTFA